MRNILKTIAIILLAMTASSASAIQTRTLCSGMTSTTTSTGIGLSNFVGAKTFQGSMTVSSGSGSATIQIQASLDSTWWDTIATVSVTDTASDSVTAVTPVYAYYRCNVTAISGTGASAAVSVGTQ